MNTKHLFNVVKYPSNVLSTPTQVVKFEELNIAALKMRMNKVIQRTKGLALAAPQIGIPKSFFYYNGELYLNPNIKSHKDDKITEKEGCLSVPGVDFPVTRWAAIVLVWTDTKGNSHEEEFSGYEARIIQHEVDHLKGVCLPDLIK